MPTNAFPSPRLRSHLIYMVVFFAFVYLTSIWQDFIVSNALLCFSGVTPAQQPAVTDIGTSGRNAFISKAFETTQMSVHNPISSIDSIFFSL